MKNLSVNLAGVTLKNPLIAASGTFGFGLEYTSLYPLAAFGGVSLKGLTREPRAGNPAPRVAETPSGLLNSVGLENPGVERFITEALPKLAGENIAVIANIAGSTVDDYAYLAERLNENPVVDMLEVNISCPNVRHGGAAFGTSASIAAEVTRAVKDNTRKPVMVKLSPNVTDITEIARAVEAAGADAISLINTLLGMRINLKTRRPILKNNYGGLSGPAVFPVALRMVNQVYNAVDVPIVGLGGVSSGEDVVEMIMAGACAVQIGSVMFNNPLAPVDILRELEDWMSENGINDLSGLVGAAKLW